MKRQLGFGLLEILIAMVVLGVAVVGLVAFSKSALIASQDGRRYEIAMRLAESKLDEFRNFNSATSAAAPLTTYESILPNLVGIKRVYSNDEYTLTWDVVDKFWNITSSDWQDNVPPSGYTAPTSGQKTVTVFVSWKDSGGIDKKLQLASNISPTSSLLKPDLNGGLDSSRTGPKAIYTKGSIPDVVAIALDDNGNNKETSKPLPHISGGSSSSRTIQFDTTTYQTTGTTSNSKAVQDYATVYCNCSTASDLEKAYLPAQLDYIESYQVQYWKAGDQVSKAIGTLDGNDNEQETLCPVCCREHNDVSTSSKNFFEYYSPLNTDRASTRYRDNTEGGLALTSSGEYVDACRFIRIDGYYRPAPDWHLIALTTLSSHFLSNDTNRENYKEYIAYAVKEHTKWQRKAFCGKGDDNWSWPATSKPAPIKSFSTWLTDNDIDITTTLSTSINKTTQLMSRGIYVDTMSPSYLDEVFKSLDCNPISLPEPDLTKIPFQDVNMTLLSEWSSNSTNGDIISNQPIKTIVDPDHGYYGNYSRGLLTAKSTTFTGAGTPPKDVPITITAKSYQGNSGVVGVPVLQADIDNLISSDMLVSINAQAQETEYLFVVQCLRRKKNGSGAENCADTIQPDIRVQGGLSVACNRISAPGNTSTAVYACTGAPGTSFTLDFSKSLFQVTATYNPLSTVVLALPAVGGSQTTQLCVMMVEEALKAANPSTSTTCSPTTTTPTP